MERGASLWKEIYIIEMIRYAVGAVIFQQSELLLINKVKISATKEMLTQGEWDFPKGGVEKSDTSFEAALLRELFEETGSTQYKIIKQLDEKITFPFNQEFINQTGYTKQETTMFLVEYTGNRTDLLPQDKEIAAIEFFSFEQTLVKLTHQDTKNYLKKMLENKDL